MEAVTVRNATESELETILPIYLAALKDEVVNAWSFAAPASEDFPAEFVEEFFRKSMGEFLRRSVAEDEVWVGERGGRILAVSVWLPNDPLGKLQAAADNAEAAAAAIGIPALRRTATVARLLVDIHARDLPPYVFGYSLGVLPEHRGAGAGGAIMRHRAALADREGKVMYAQASTEDSARLYRRLGFVDCGRHRLPEGGPELISIRRYPVIS